MLSAVSSVFFCFIPKKPESEWQKVEYILELSGWLYYKQFPMEDVIFHLQWAVDILTLITPARDRPEGAGEGAVCSDSGPARRGRVLTASAGTCARGRSLGQYP